jgi:hypothetical protein
MNTKKIFTGGINQDDAHIILKENEYLNALNVRVVTSRDGKVGFVSTIEGTTQKSVTLPTGTNKTIGVCEDSRRLRLFFFNQNSSGNHGIYCYDSVANTVYTVLLNSQVTGGLNFSALIPSASIVDNLLYWTDGVNPPRRMNVEAGIKLNHAGYTTAVAPYTNPIAQSVITVIRNQPAYSLTVAKAIVADADYSNNFIKDEAFQFAYRFVYRDGEVSAFSHWSRLINFNTNQETTDDYRAINVTVPSAQPLPQDLKRIEVAVRYYLDGRMFIIKKFTTFTGTLTFQFFNDFIGIAVDDATATKQFDSVPLKSLALEVAKDRLFLGNNTEGYDTPTITSLTNTVIPSTGGSTNTTPGEWYKVDFRVMTGPEIYTVYVLEIPGIVDKGYYRTNPITTVPPTSTTRSWVGLAYIGPVYTDLLAALDAIYGPSEILDFTNFLEVTVTNVPSGQLNSLSNSVGFKSAAYYRMGLVFYDEAGRKSGVVTKDELKFVTPERNYALTSYITGVSWSLTNNADLNIRQQEIPAWAKYYSIVMTKCLRTNFFMQLRSDGIKYVSRNATTGEYSDTNSHSPTLYGTLIDIKSLFAIGYGYTYQPGDIIKLHTDTGALYNLNIKDTYGEYVICDLVNLSGVTYVLYEIYTPLFSTFDDTYYEKEDVYPIVNPGATNRSYSTTSGTIAGDIYLVQRSIPTASPYLVEAMSPNDFKWKEWNVNIGRVNVVTTTGQVVKTGNVRFSNVIILGTETNGLCTFDSLDDTSLPYEMGPLYKLILASKVQDEGTIMLAIGQHETASLYLGETRVFDNSGSSFLAKSSGVIGTVNVLKGSYGTTNPESVAEWLGTVYWFDASKGGVIRYDSNGLFPVSSYKMMRYFRSVGFDTIAGGYKVFGGVDPYHGEFLIMAPRKTVIPQNGVLTDMELNTFTVPFNEQTNIDLSAVLNAGSVYKYTTTGGSVTVTYAGQTLSGTFFYDGYTNILNVFPAAPGTFSIIFTEVEKSTYSAYDGHGGVYAFQPGLDRWTSKYSFVPDYMSMVANRLVSFRNGVPHVHDSQSHNTFYGVTFDSSITTVHTEATNVIKKYYALFVEGDTPNLVHVRTEAPNVQSSDIRSGTYDPRLMTNGDFTIKEGVSYASILRDRLSPNIAGVYDRRLMFGDDMIGEVGMFTVVYKRPTSLKNLKLFNIGFIPSRGHTIE